MLNFTSIVLLTGKVKRSGKEKEINASISQGLLLNLLCCCLNMERFVSKWRENSYGHLP